MHTTIQTYYYVTYETWPKMICHAELRKKNICSVYISTFTYNSEPLLLLLYSESFDSSDGYWFTHNNSQLSHSIHRLGLLLGNFPILIRKSKMWDFHTIFDPFP